MTENQKLREVLQHAIEDLSSATSFLTRRSRDRQSKTVAALAKLQADIIALPTADPLTRYRVWPDGTVQEGSESPHAWMSDDFEYVDAISEEQAALSAGAYGIDAAMRKDKL